MVAEEGIVTDRLGGLAAALGVLQAVALAAGFDDVAAMGQSIQRGAGQSGL